MPGETDAVLTWLRDHAVIVPTPDLEGIVTELGSSIMRTPSEETIHAFLRDLWEQKMLLAVVNERGLAFYAPTSPPPQWLLEDMRVVQSPFTSADPIPAPATTPPLVPDAFGGGSAEVPVNRAVQAVLRAFYDATLGEDWHWQPGEGGAPRHVVETQKGERIETAILPLLAKDPMTEAVLTQLWETAKRLDDLTGDVLLVCLAQSLIRPELDGSVWITVDAILNYRGLVPKTKRAGKRVERAGHREERRQAVRDAMADLSMVWVELREVQVREASEKRRGRPRTVTYTSKGRVIVISQVLTQKRLDGTEVIVAWRFRTGDWMAPFLKARNRYTTHLLQQALEYDPYHERWEKRLARYCMFHFKMDGRTQIKREIGHVLDELRLPINERYPEKTKRRFEDALTRLRQDGIIASWQYAIEGTLPARKWLGAWLRWDVILTTPDAVATAAPV